jgi:hypothetical protein
VADIATAADDAAVCRQLSGGSAGSSNSVRLPEGHLARVLPLWFMAKEMGFRMKLNTVVTRANL